MQARRFFLDTQTRQFVGGFNAQFLSSSPAFFDEDVEKIELYFLEPTGDVTAPYRALNYSGNTVKLAVGLTAPAAQQTAWTSVSTSITASITTLTTGGSGANEAQKITFSGATPNDGGFSITIPSRLVDTNPAGTLTGNFLYLPNHGFLTGQQILIGTIDTSTTTYEDAYWYVLNATKDAFQISQTASGPALTNIENIDNGIVTAAVTTPQIAFNAGPEAVQQAFIDAGLQVGGSPQIIVTGSYSSGYVLTFANALGNINWPTVTVSSIMTAAPALTGNLSFATNEIAALISAGNTNNLRMEVEVSDGTLRQTYSTAAAISNDIITSSSAAPLPTITPASSFNVTSPDASVWNITIDNNGVLTATKT
jgi:hypothetical protein